jgi:quercetin dioxygenase-like cupin family protein
MAAPIKDFDPMKTKKTAKKKMGSSRARKSFALKGTAKKTRKQAAATLQYLPWEQVELEDINPLFQRQMIVGQQVMLARVLLKKGCIVPLHSHVNEQLTYILDGALKFWIDNQEIVVRAGQVLTIPPNMPHKAEALEDTVDLDIFHPPRADWLSKTDSYLRK